MRARAARLAPLILLALAAGCATAPGEREESVARPEWKVGDRWVFRRTSPEGGTVVVTHQVTAASGAGFTMRIAGMGWEVTRYWTPDLHLALQTAAGAAPSEFQPAARYFAWPLALGKAWTQEFEYRDGAHDGRYVNSWQVGKAVEPVDVLAGSFLALRIERRGSQGERLETYWYVPPVRYWVRLENHLGAYTEELVEPPVLRP